MIIYNSPMNNKIKSIDIVKTLKSCIQSLGINLKLSLKNKINLNLLKVCHQ